MEDIAGEKVNDLTQLLAQSDEPQPRKVEELLPEDDIMPDTYLIYPTGGYHPFYGVPNTFPRYQLPIWPFIKRIKFHERWKSKEKLDIVRRKNLRENYDNSQLNPYVNKDYMYANILTTGRKGYFDKNRQKIYNGMLNKKRLMHRLVALAFIPNPRNREVVMHKNDDSTNYLIKNLKWGTASENARGSKFRSPDTMEQKYLNLINRGIIKG